MLNHEFINKKIDLITTDIKRLEEFKDFTISQMAQNHIKYAALKNFLMEIIGRAIDINQHLVLEKADLKEKAPLDYTESFLYLAKVGILPEDFAKQISKSAGFRNAIVHSYNNIDQGLVYQSVGDAIEQYTKYCGYIISFLEQSGDL